jgi:putative protease
MVAIDNGADAVYIGAPAFGARQAAANSVEEIERLVHYAHRFYCRVYVTLNTLLYDRELQEAERLAHRLCRIGADALIIQDPAFLQMDLPPIPLHASTQMHNYEPERIRFLDRLGFQRIVLARELSLEQIRQIRQEVKAELEVFVHGALCVGLSGQCYLSGYLSGRSANRGECMQACRLKWRVEDGEGKQVLPEGYHLSLKDLNNSGSLSGLLEAGVDSLKIEGRLKDANYVANVVNHYHSMLSGMKNIERRGSGEVFSGFRPDPERSFNRGFSTYFLHGREPGLVNRDTPKSVGKRMGTALRVQGERLLLQTTEEVHNGDGLCYVEQGELKGIRVNQKEGEWLVCNERLSVKPGSVIYRNRDRLFAAEVEKNGSERRIGIRVRAAASGGKLQLSAVDEDGNGAVVAPEEFFPPAVKEEQRERIREQLSKWGGSGFYCREAVYEGEVLFVPSARLNAFRRELQERLEQLREEKREVLLQPPFDRTLFYKKQIDWKHNVVNKLAADFYREHGAEDIETGFEAGFEGGGASGVGKELMRCRYCLLFEAGMCRKRGGKGVSSPLWLRNGQHRFRLEFDCGACCMKIYS